MARVPKIQKSLHTLKIPSFLKPGDTIGISATARKVTAPELANAIDLFESWGLNVKLASNIFQSHHQFAGTDAERAEGLQELIDDSSVKAIINARGGYGTLRIIDQLNFDKFLVKPKWICGFSDVTVLHSHIWTKFNIPTIHCAMAFKVENENATTTLRSALFGSSLKYSAEPNEMNREGAAEAEVIGGNLSLLYALQASGSDIQTENKILFIEDLDEYLYHIDRMILSLKRAGKLDKLAGLIIGGMTDMKDNLTPFGYIVEQIIMDAVATFDYPVMFNFPAGHIDNNQALVLGCKIKMEVNKKGGKVSYLPPSAI